MPTLSPARAPAHPGPRAEDHIDWARGVAAAVCRAHRLRGAERDDIESVAVEALLELLDRPDGFDPRRVPPGGDPAGAFRGWAHPSIRCRCVRAVLALWGGGTFRTKRPGRAVIAAPLGDSAAGISDDEPQQPTATPDLTSGAVILDEKPDTHYGRKFRSTRFRGVA